MVRRLREGLRLMRLIHLALCSMLLAASGSAAAAEPSAEDRASAQSAISAQIEAFDRDDGPAAYALAADAIRALFPSPDAFMDMVKRAYAPVYRPKSVVFGPATDAGGGLTQEALITDQSGVDWIAQYTLARDAEGRWRITGCRLVKNERQSA